jgi:hypothetical protein
MYANRAEGSKMNRGRSEGRDAYAMSKRSSSMMRGMQERRKLSPEELESSPERKPMRSGLRGNQMAEGRAPASNIITLKSSGGPNTGFRGPQRKFRDEEEGG